MNMGLEETELEGGNSEAEKSFHSHCHLISVYNMLT